MTESNARNELKMLLRDYQDMQIQLQFLQKYKEKEEKCKEIMRITELLNAAIRILDDKERFVIENHLIFHYTWPKTIIKVNEYFGIEESRSERTFKRIQNRALDKMLLFIDKIE